MKWKEEGRRERESCDVMGEKRGRGKSMKIYERKKIHNSQKLENFLSPRQPFAPCCLIEEKWRDKVGWLGVDEGWRMEKGIDVDKVDEARTNVLHVFPFHLCKA